MSKKKEFSIFDSVAESLTNSLLKVKNKVEDKLIDSIPYESPKEKLQLILKVSKDEKDFIANVVNYIKDRAKNKFSKPQALQMEGYLLIEKNDSIVTAKKRIKEFYEANSYRDNYESSEKYKKEAREEFERDRGFNENQKKEDNIAVLEKIFDLENSINEIKEDVKLKNYSKSFREFQIKIKDKINEIHELLRLHSAKY
jgi:hypothetical protein